MIVKILRQTNRRLHAHEILLFAIDDETLSISGLSLSNFDFTTTVCLCVNDRK